jgi:putative transposase
MMRSKKTVEDARDELKPDAVFYYADEFNISGHPTLRALWSPKGQQVMIPTPMQPTRRYGLGAVNWHTGESLVITRHHKRRREVAELRGAAGRLVLLYLPTYSPWLNPIEMLWRQFRREVTHCELFDTVQDLLIATRAFFDRGNHSPDKVRTIIGAHPT